MSWYKVNAYSRANKKHADRRRTCACGKEIKGNAYYRHRQVCSAAKKRYRDACLAAGVEPPLWTLDAPNQQSV